MAGVDLPSEPSRLVLQLSGDFESYHRADLRRLHLQARHDGRPLTLDLSNVGVVDRRGIAWLTRLAERRGVGLRQHPGAVVTSVAHRRQPGRLPRVSHSLTARVAGSA